MCVLFMNFGRKLSSVISGVYWSLLCLLVGSNLFLAFFYRVIPIEKRADVFVFILCLFGGVFFVLLYQIIKTISKKASLSREVIFLGFCILFMNVIFILSVIGGYLE